MAKMRILGGIFLANFSFVLGSWQSLFILYNEYHNLYAISFSFIKTYKWLRLTNISCASAATKRLFYLSEDILQEKNIIN